jgi:micrococcal nuclease
VKLLLIILLLITTSVKAEELKVLRVIDGDTVLISAPFLPKPLKPQLYLRLYGIDTPESKGRAKCKRERELAVLAKNYVENRINSASNIEIILLKWDKYGGRVLGDLILDDTSLTLSMIKNGYAYEYFGRKRKSWCGVYFSR